MVIEVAGVTAEICLRYAENERHYEGYITDKPPVLTIAPTDADIHHWQAILDRKAERWGLPPEDHSEALAEEDAIHYAVCKALIDRDVLPMHGSALCMDGEAYIFAAASCTGKSTHSRYWREVYGDRVWMISDDRPFLKFTERGIMVCGNPWNDIRYPGRNACAPLKAIVRLCRDSGNHIEPLSDADGYQMMLMRSWPPIMSRSSLNPARKAHVAALAERVVRAAAFYSLGCNMSPEAAVVAHDGMNAGKT